MKLFAVLVILAASVLVSFRLEIFLIFIAKQTLTVDRSRRQWTNLVGGAIHGSR